MPNFIPTKDAVYKLKKYLHLQDVLLSQKKLFFLAPFCLWTFREEERLDSATEIPY